MGLEWVRKVGLQVQNEGGWEVFGSGMLEEVGFGY